MKVTCHYRNDPEQPLTDPLPELGGRRFIFRMYSGDVCFPLLGTFFGEKWFEPPFPRWVVQFCWDTQLRLIIGGVLLSLAMLALAFDLHTLANVLLAAVVAAQMPLPFIAWRWPGTSRAAYLGFKLYGVDRPEYLQWLCGPEDVFDGSHALCLTVRPSARIK